MLKVYRRILSTDEMSDDRNVSIELRALIARAGLTITAFAKKMGYSHRSGVQRYIDLKDPLDNLPYDVADKAAKMLAGLGNPPIVKAEVMRLGPHGDNVQEYGGVVQDITYMSWVAAGKLASVDAIVNDGDLPTVKVADLPIGEYIALRVSGDSMNLVAAHGTTIIVSIREKDLRDGWYYVISVGGETTFKKYRSNPARFEGESSYPQETLYPLGPVEVVGRVVKAQRDL